MEKRYIHRRRPCWVCSSPLATVTTGPNAGAYVGVVVDAGDGHEHLAHESCVGWASDVIDKVAAEEHRLRQDPDSPY